MRLALRRLRRPAPSLRPWPAPGPARARGAGLWLAWALLLAVVLVAAGTEVRAEPAPARGALPGPACATCGVVTAVARIDAPGRATGVGAVVGGAVGLMVGRELGRQRDRHGERTPMAVLGAVGGGLIGHQIEKQVRRRTVYEVDVRMADGRLRQLSQSHPVRLGERVIVREGQAWPEAEAPDRPGPVPEPTPPWRGERA